MTFVRDVEAARTDAYIWQLRRISKALGLSFERVLKEAGRTARMDAGLLKIMTRLAAKYPARRDA